MYVRFVVSERDKYSEQKKGVFVVAYDLLRDGYLPDREHSYLRGLLDRFVQDLPTPSKSARKLLKDRAIFWLNANWTWFAEPLRELSGVLVRSGYRVEILSTT